MIIERNCKQCGTIFKTSSYKINDNRGKFCSRECASLWRSGHMRGENAPAWKGGWIQRACKQCGNIFSTAPAWIKDGCGVFCSRKCHDNWRSANKRGTNNPQWVARVKCTCLQCSISFEQTPKRIAGGSGKFCSSKCYHQWRSKRVPKGKDSPVWKGGDIPRKCTQCGCDFKAKRYQVANGTGRFCSQKCANIWKSMNLRGENSHMWKGGSFGKYCPKFNNPFKQRVRAFFDYKCVECGEPQSNYKLHAHHVYYNKKACCEEDSEGHYIHTLPEGQRVVVQGDPNKFVSLCRSCHVRTQSSRLFWALHFEKIINEYYGGRSWMTDEEYAARILGKKES